MRYFQVILILMYLYLYRRVWHSLKWKQILDLDKIYLETWTFSVPFQDINIPFIFNLSVFHDLLVLYVSWKLPTYPSPFHLICR